jgi:hypothetical protein
MLTYIKARWRRLTAVACTASVLALAPATAWAAEPGRAPTAGSGGSTVSIGSGLLAIALALWLGRNRGAIALVVLAFAAGAMLSGSQVADALSQLVDQGFHACVNAATGAVA